MMRAALGVSAVLVLVGATGSVSAQPKPARVCVRNDAMATLVTSGGAAILVADDTYLGFTAEPALIAKPSSFDPEQRLPDAIRRRGKKVMACAGKACRPLGRTIAAQFPEPTRLVPRDGDDGGLTGEIAGSAGTVTADLKLLVHNNMHVYSIALDRGIQLAAPPGVTVASPIEVEPYGNVLLTFWGNTAAIYNAKGIIGATFPAGARVVLSPNRLVVAGPSVTIIDTRSGKQLGSLELDAAVDQRRAVKLATDRFVVAWEVGGAWKVTWIKVSAKGVPTVEKQVAIPVC